MTTQPIKRQRITDPKLQKFGQVMRQLLAGAVDGRHYTMTDYAESLTKSGYPISRVQLSNYLNYKSIPGVDTLLAISDKENITTDQLLRGLDYTPEKYQESEAKAQQADTLSVQNAKLQAKLTQSKAQLTISQEENEKLKEEIKKLKQQHSTNNHPDNNTGDDLDFLQALDQILKHSRTYKGYRLNDAQKATIKRLTRAYLDV